MKNKRQTTLLALTMLVVGIVALGQAYADPRYEVSGASTACRDEANACSGNPFSHNFDYRKYTAKMCYYDSNTDHFLYSIITTNCQVTHTGCCWYEHEDDCPETNEECPVTYK